MPTVIASDLARMRDQLFLDGPTAGAKRSRFWILLVAASIIATAGVIGDSTATVIGAMIVAPLMTPILGIVLAIVLPDRANLVRSLALVIVGATLVVAIAWLIGSIIQVPVLETTNTQVAARVSPRLIDLLAALATGAVGAFALCRADISDTLPGVAIAISLVPPLAVVGLTLESGAPDQARGALLLFVTNVVAILASGIVVMVLHRVHRLAATEQPAAGADAVVHRRRATLVVAALVVAVCVPLAATSTVVGRTTVNEHRVRRVADHWAERGDWSVIEVTTAQGRVVVVRAVGAGDPPDTKQLRRDLDEAGLGAVDVDVELIPEIRASLPGH